MTVSLFFAWYDLWIGAYYDRHTETLYVCPLPCCVIKLHRHHWITQLTGGPVDPVERSGVCLLCGEVFEVQP